MKTTAVLLAAVTLSCVVGTGDVNASVATGTLTSPAASSATTRAGEITVAELAAARRAAGSDATGGRRRAAGERSAASRASGGVTAPATVPAATTDGTPRVPVEVPNPPARVRAKVSRFTLSSSTWKSGSAAPKIKLRIAASKATAARAQVRIEDRRRRVIARQSLGMIKSGVNITKTVTKRLSSKPGSYRLRLIMRDATGRKTRARARTLRVTESKSAAPTAPDPVTAPSAAGYVFPVQGACNFRSLSSQEFRAPRSGGRLHNGHDIGTFSDYPPVVAVVGGVVERVWHDDAGGGWTIIFNGDDGIAYGYLHLKPGTIAVKPGDRVAAGQGVAHAGKSGGNYDPHLHFEMRPIPWDQNRAAAIDPLPLLLKLPNRCSG